MIGKASQRANGKQLGKHLASHENERVSFIKSSGLMGQNMDDALAEMELVASGSRAQKPLFHAMISPHPGEEMTSEKWERAWEIFTKTHGLEGLQYAIVEHEKSGRIHQHAVFNRVDPETMTARNLGFTHIKNELAMRLCELEFGHELTKGHHNRAVIEHLKRTGQLDKAEALAGLAEGQTPQAIMTHAEHQMQRRGVPISQTRAELAEAWRASDSAQAFEAALAERGYLLAQGDKVAVVVRSADGREIPALRAINAGLKAEGLRRIGKADLADRLPVVMADVDAVRDAFSERLEQLQQQPRNLHEEQSQMSGDNSSMGRLAPVGEARKAIKAKGKAEDKREWREARERMLFEVYGQQFKGNELAQYWRIHRAEDRRVHFRNKNGEIIDQGEVLSVKAKAGKAQLVAARAAVAIAQAKGWREIQVTGSEEFRVATYRAVIEAQQAGEKISIEVADNDRETFERIRAEVIVRQGVDMDKVRELHRQKTGNALSAAPGSSSSNVAQPEQDLGSAERPGTRLG